MQGLCVLCITIPVGVGHGIFWGEVREEKFMQIVERSKWAAFTLPLCSPVLSCRVVFPLCLSLYQALVRVAVALFVVLLSTAIKKKDIFENSTLPVSVFVCLQAKAAHIPVRAEGPGKWTAGSQCPAWLSSTLWRRLHAENAGAAGCQQEICIETTSPTTPH